MQIRNSTIVLGMLSLLLAACSDTAPNTKPAAESSDSATMPSSDLTNSGKIKYPLTRMGDVVDTYFETKVNDPFRWLEDDQSDETANWVKAQNKVTFSYLNKIPYRNRLKKRLADNWNYEKQSVPYKEGRYVYFYHNTGLQEQDLVYRYLEQGETEGDAEVFLDPNKFSADGTTSLAGMDFSRDGSLIAYLISEGGSDWRKVIILDVQTKKQLEAPLIDVKFSGISWRGNEGFYYSSYDKPEGSELSAKTDQHKVYFHRIGEPQSQDELIFGGSAAEKRRYLSAQVTDDDRFLLISGANSTSGNDLILKDLSKPDSGFVTVLSGFDSDTYLLANHDQTLIFTTNLNAPNKKIVSVNAASPGAEHWRDLIPETNNVLRGSVGGGSIFTHYMLDATSKVFQYDYSGKKIREVNLPGLGTATSIKGKLEAETLYYKFTNYYTPSTIYQIDVKTGVAGIYKASKAKFDVEAYESKQVFYASKDGTKIPMIITYKKGMKLDGNNPTMLYGYGGFNVSLTPSFRVSNSVWLELGGIYAVPNLRGGGEYGKQWHVSGTLRQKQNVFDDFIAAAEYLIDEQYTRKRLLAISGRSNGGLLVGAVMTQRPDLVQVALPGVGVMDMLRYHTFTAGAGWAYDYGTAQQSAEMFSYLLSYSPVHNVVAGKHYPATLVTTADHDDRVVPAHSFKFAAELQRKQAGIQPTFIRIETSAGHGPGTPVSKKIEKAADIYAFTLFNMGYESLAE